MKQFFFTLSVLCGLLLSSCTPALPPEKVADKAKESASSSAADISVIEQLMVLQLPEGLNRKKIGTAMWFSNPLVVNAETDPRNALEGAFAVEPLENLDCTDSFARDQITINFGLNSTQQPGILSINSVATGYEWPAYFGVAGDATPNLLSMCVHTNTIGTDVQINVYMNDQAMITYVKDVFIPLWVEVNSN